MKYLKYLFLAFCSLYWPVSLYLANSQNWLTLVVPGLLIGISLIFLSQRKLKPLFVVPLLLVFFIQLKSLSGNTIFTYDPLSYDTQVKKMSQIPNRLLGRLVQNKYLLYLDKFSGNFFFNLDLNNYFFALHPRETGNNQNLNKFPFFALILFLFGLVKCFSTSRKKYLLFFLGLIVYLSFWANQDKADFILWPLILMFLFEGDTFLENKFPRLSPPFYLFGTLFAALDFIRIIFLSL